MCQKATAKQSVSDSQCQTACVRQTLPDTQCHTACVRHPVSDSDCHAACIRQPPPDSMCQTACVRQTSSDSLCQTATARQPISDSCVRQPVSDSHSTNAPKGLENRLSVHEWRTSSKRKRNPSRYLFQNTDAVQQHESHHVTSGGTSPTALCHPFVWATEGNRESNQYKG